MSKLHDLIGKVENAELRAALADECRKLEKGKRFGLVFEEHLPEATPIPGAVIKVGATVATKAQDGGALFRVVSIEGDVAKCVPVSFNTEEQRSRELWTRLSQTRQKQTTPSSSDAIGTIASTGATDSISAFPLAELVVVAKFGEPIYPYLEKLDEFEHGGGDLWHALIQADNYHALQLLEYLYAGQVDCIYIDPPYNTGAKDWKYNNDYVDSNDCYRHSKWLSMMERRLKIAKRLLNPKDSVLIVTIDEKEYLHLGMLLEQMFPEARIQMVASQITPQGNPRVQQFYRTDEYIYFVGFGAAQPASLPLDENWRTGVGDAPKKNINWVSLLRTGSARKREDRPLMFYPFFIRNTDEGPVIDSIGESYLGDAHKDVRGPEGTTAVWPIGSDGELRRWQVSSSSARQLKDGGFLRLGRWNGSDTAVQYLAEGNREGISTGQIPVIGKRYDGSFVVADDYVASFIPGTIWKIPSHDATRSGSQLLSKILSDKRFSFPKSLYAVHDAIRFFVANKPNALILDFFAGSGTTLHAVNLLNAEDGGKRRCILVTNNEVSNDEAAAFRKRGLNPGDAEWEARGIAQYVTWPRTTCSIKGVNVKGEPLKGEYITSKGGVGVPMREGFKANAVFFKLGFLDPGAVSMGRRFKELLPLLWMKAGAVGKCPACGECGHYQIWTENRMAVLFHEGAFAAFAREVKAQPEIMTVYLITDYEPSFRAMAKSFPGRRVYQLYRDYRDNFRLNQGGRA